MSNPSVYLFGDDHTDNRGEVKERLLSVIPEDAELVVVEHPEKGDNRRQPSNWVWLKNPSLLLLQFISVAIQIPKRWRADRVVHGNQTTVAEEVAGELEIPVAFTDVSWPNKIAAQPKYLTVSSWMAFLMIFLGWLVHPGFLFGAIVFVPLVAARSQTVFHRIRETKMAQDLHDYCENHQVVVFFAGDSHIEPVADRVDGELDAIVKPNARVEA